MPRSAYSNPSPNASLDRQPASSVLYTHTVGSGPDLVLVHGWGMHSGVWEDVAEQLLDDYRVTVIDLPGYGFSRALTERYDLDALCAAVAAAVPAPAAWLGWSLGGLVAQRVAMTSPERVSRLILTNSSPCFVQRPDWPHAIAPALLQRFAEELQQDYRAVLKRFIALEVYGSENASEQLRQLRAMLFQHGEPRVSALEDGLVILERTDLRSAWAHIACPILLLMGERDQLVPVKAAEVLTAQWPHSQLHIFEGAGHAPFFSHLSDFIAEVRAFLNG